jgi:FAD/FMN-containing dehydrogenase
MREPTSRRGFLKLVAAGSGLATGFDPGTRLWAAPQAQPPQFRNFPKLDGEFVADEAVRRAASNDYGHLVHRLPSAVVRPASVRDVANTVKFANRHSLKIAMRGQGHSKYGQCQVEGGIVIDSSFLNAIGNSTSEWIDVQPGLILGQLGGATLASGSTPPVLPVCMILSVGGTLSAGGLGNSSQRYGAMIDNVIEMDVVTGDGQLVTCSRGVNSELFNMVLGGMGQCGIIVRARMKLVPVASHALIDVLVYDDLDKFLVDQARIASEGNFDHQYGYASRKGDGPWQFTMEVGKFFSPPDEPKLSSMEQGLMFASHTASVRLSALDYLYRADNLGRPAATTVPTELPCASLTVWIPRSKTAEYIMKSVLSLPPKQAGFQRFSFWPLNTRRFSLPLLKVPEEEQMFSAWIIRRAPKDDRDALAAMHANTKDLLAKLDSVGGKRYAPWSPVLSADEAPAHYGSALWNRFNEAKKKFDPNGVLAPEAVRFW